MSQKDYELIAQAINDARGHAPSDAQQAAIDLVAYRVGRALSSQHRGHPWKQSRWDAATGVTRNK